MKDLGDALPQPLVTTYELAREFFHGTTRRLPALEEHLFGLGGSPWSNSLDLCLHQRRAPTLPAEFVPFADYGVDGTQAGLVVHAPELDPADVPVGAFCARDGHAVLAAGRDTRHFVEQRLSALLNLWATSGKDVERLRKFLGQDAHKAEAIAARMRATAEAERAGLQALIEALAERLDIRPAPERAGSGWEAGRVELPPPSVPDGWRYERTRDAVGVLAAKHHFDPHFALEFAEKNPRTVAGGLLRRGFPASALCVLKEHALRDAPDRPAFVRWLEPMEEAYTALGRPLHARAVQITRRNG
ncbi:MAG: hypothetical protein KIS92_19385 [Planctomycetota bacterium]|nr:hypothetical protein [Planctomycetota bacterium]